MSITTLNIAKGTNLYECIYFSYNDDQTYKLHILADDYFVAMRQMQDYLYDNHGGTKIEMIKFEMIKNELAIINAQIMDGGLYAESCDRHGIDEEGHSKFGWAWSADNPEEVGCPICDVKKTVLDKVLHFNCDCGMVFKIADNGWLSLVCPNCGEIIARDEVTRNKDGVWEYEKRNLEDLDGEN